MTKYEGVGSLQDTLDSVGTWQPGDWLIAIIGGYILYSVFSTTKRHYTSVSDTIERRRSKSAKRAKLRKELEEI
jgi:hypothetical protein